MRVDTLTPVLDAAPGEVVVGRVRVVNEGPDDATFQVRIVGLEADAAPLPVSGGALSAGLSAEVEVALTIPATLGVGQHAVALEVTSDRPGDRPALTEMTVSIESVERVELTPDPSTVRGRRSAKFVLDVVNREPHPVDVALVGAAPDVRVDLKPAVLRLQPGQRTWVRGRLRGRWRWWGEPTQHIVTLTARGRATTSSTTTAFVQRPLVPWRLRSLVACLLVVALWLGAVVAVSWWLRERRDANDTTTEQLAGDADGDGELDPLDPAAEPGAGADAGGTAGGAGAEGGDGAATGGAGAVRPTETVVGGTVQAGDTGDSSGVTVTLAPIDLGREPDGGSQVQGFASGPAGRSAGKLWSARYGRYNPVLDPVRQTRSVTEVVTGGEGRWRFDDVPVRDNYEVTFAKRGFTTQSFVVTPPEDGSAVELEVVLEPADGAVSGTVVGPDGPLGGVAISMTDGTLVFGTTTTSTGGSVGSFELGGVSTPGVYTLTATLRGYGTEVVQIVLEPGDRSDVTVRMRPGVGSIGGRITDRTAALGGVTVTATNGDVTYTTSSLTEGDTGSYSLPQLPIPGEYTVTVDAPGFVPQTRRVRLTGNATGIDFALVRTTAGVVGLVRSSLGQPIVGAGITVQRDDLSFRTTTAAAPDAGSFEIEDLPPGTYLVRIERFDHLPASRQVTVAAGQLLDLGEIVLEYSSRPPIAETGSVSVRVFDSANAELVGATVSLYELGATRPFATVSDDDRNQSTFRFDDVPIGTYRLEAVVTGYQPATVRVSVGLGPTTTEFRLFKRGQVGGRVVDAVTGATLPGYRVSIFQIVGGLETFVDQRSPRLVDGEWIWESEPESLLAGQYRIDVVFPSPTGYRIVPDQVIDPDFAGTPNTMRFEIAPDEEDPVVLEPLEADPYPSISGSVFRPVQLPGTLLPRFDPIDAADLAADVSCDGGATWVPADVGSSPGSLDEPDRFTIPRAVVQERGLLGTCQVRVAAGGYRTTLAALSGTVAISEGGTSSDRSINVVLTGDAAGPLAGRLYWLNGGVPEGVGGATVRTDGETVVAFPPAQATGADAALPSASTRTLSTTSRPDGGWSFDRVGQYQVFGETVYLIEAPGFEDASIQVTIDADRDVTALTNATVTGEIAGVVQVLLGRPLPGELTGELTIVSVKETPPFGDVDIVPTGPPPPDPADPVGSLDRTDPPFLVSPAPVLAPEPDHDDRVDTQPFTVEDAPAGPWSVTFTPDTTRLVPWQGSETTVDGAVPPGAPADGFDATFLELGQIDVAATFQTTPGSAAGPAGQFALTGPATSRSGPLVAGVEAPDLAVDAAQPLRTEVTYDLSLSRAGYDVAGAAVTVTDAARPVPATPLPAQPDARSTTIGVLAGSDVVATTTIQQYGRLDGEVLGEIRPGDRAGLTLTAGQVTATLVDVAGTPLPADQQALVSVSVDGSSFSVAGPPGYYRLGFAVPGYGTSPLQWLESGPDDVDLAGTPLYRIANTVARPFATGDDAVVLPALPGSVSLTAVQAGGVGVAGARVRLYADDADLSDPATTPLYEATTAADDPLTPLVDETGTVSFPAVAPDLYLLEVRLLDVDGRDEAFPVIGRFNVALAADASARTVSLRVHLPLLDRSITGTVTAVNGVGTDGEAVPVPLAVRVERRYEPTGIDQLLPSPTTIPNEATDAAVVPRPDAVPDGDGVAGNDGDPSTVEIARRVDATPLTSSFTFARVPQGTHVLTFEAAPPGYVLHRAPPGSTFEGGGATPNELTVVVPVVGDLPLGTVVYRALDVDVSVDVAGAAGGEFVDLSATLWSADPDVPGSGATPVGSAAFDASDASAVTVTFADVPPRAAPYHLEVDDTLHARQVIPVTITPDTDAATAPGQQLDPMTLSGDVARVTGALQQQDTATGAATTLVGPASVVLTGGATTPTSPYPAGTTTGYTFDVPTTTGLDRVVEVTKLLAGGATDEDYTTANLPVALVPGTVVTPDPIVLLKRSTFTVTVANAALPVGTTVTPSDCTPAATVHVAGSAVWTFKVDPAPSPAGCVFTVSAPSHYPVRLPATGRYSLVTGGNTAPSAVTLAPRTASVTVALGSGSPPVDVTVAIAIGSNPVVSQTRQLTGSSLAFSFPANATTGPFLALEGAGTMTISAPGYRDRVISFATGATAIAGGSVSLYGPVTVSGTVTNAPDGTTVEAYLGDATTPTHTTTTATVEGVAGRYTFPDGFGNGAWRIDAVASLGVGDAPPVAVTIDGATPAGTTLTAPTATWAARSAEATFSITRSAASTTAASVEIFANATEIGSNVASPTPLGTTAVTVTRTFTENAATPLTYRITHVGSFTETGTMSLADFTVTPVTGANDELVRTFPVPLVAAPTISGDVTAASGGVSGTVVRLYRNACPAAPTAPSAANLITTLPAVGGNGAFSFTAAQSVTSTGAHCLFATVGADATLRTGRANLNVAKSSTAITQNVAISTGG